MKETKFKQTEIGMIPDDWEVKEINEIKQKLVVGFVGTCEKYYTNSSSGIPMIRTGDLKDTCVDFSNTKYIQKTFHDSNKKSQLKRNDILIARHGSNGHGVLYETDIEANSLNIVILHINEEEVNSKYLVYQLDTESLHSQITEVSAGSTQSVINTSQIGKLSVPLPPTLAEQRKIAKALSDVDNVISTLEKLITKKKNLKQGTMQQLLTGKKRLPGFAKSDKFKLTEIGEIPEDWEVKELEEVSKNYTGLTYSPKNINEYGTLVLRSSNIQDDMLSFDDNVYVNMNVPERAIAHTGDILICVRNGSKRLIGKSALITESANNCAFGAFMTILRTELLNQQFLFYVWQSDLIQKQIEESMGATINQITNKDIRHYLIAYPKSNAEQTAIANVLSSMDKEIEALEAKLGKYRDLKTGMMQQLLTGKIRLV